jgi:hypothetical protein
MGEYHASAAIGSSDIRDFLRSPRLFKDKRDGLVPDDDTPAKLMGTLTHLAMLEPERFRQSIAIKPEGMSFATKDGKEWKEAHKGREIIKQDDYTAIHMMQQRMPAECRAALSSGRSEVTVRTMMAGLAVQCRVDHWDESADILYDLKSIDAIENVAREIYKRGYHIQAEWYRRVVATERRRGDTDMLRMPGFVLIFCEKAFPFRWRIVELDPDYVAIAEAAIGDALHGINARIVSGCWDDAESLYLTASPPHWLAGDITETPEGISL